VPVLGFAGDHDVRTPVGAARATVARFRQGKLLVVPGAGHAVLGGVAGCADRAVADWLRGVAAPAGCTRSTAVVAPAPVPPVRAVGRAGFVRAVRATVADAQALLALGAYDGRAFETIGLAGGTIRVGRYGATLDEESLVPGVAISGRLFFVPSEPQPFVGALEACGPNGLRARVRVLGGVTRIETGLRSVRSCA
jgi:hypothetical protein